VLGCCPKCCAYCRYEELKGRANEFVDAILEQRTGEEPV
jgi:hypothetical protein